MVHPYIGIDVGGTKIEATLLGLGDPHHFTVDEVLDRKRIPTERQNGLESFMARLGRMLQDLLKSHHLELSQVVGIGIGMPGSIHPKTQRMGQGSIPFFKDQDLVGLFQKKLGYSGSILFENDGNCFALAEASFGAGAEWFHDQALSPSEISMIGITLGTGVGGGLILNGKLIRGARGAAGEIGHMTLKDSDQPCYCGKFGCVEHFLSGPGLELAFQKKTKNADLISGKQIFEMARNQDPHAISTLETYREDLIQFLSNLSNLLDPHLFVLGGGLSMESELYQGLEEGLSERCFLTENPPPVLKNKLGDAAGSLGAAFLAFQAVQKRIHLK